VKEVMHTNYVTIPHNTPLYQLLHIFEETRDDFFPVVDSEGNLLGTLSFQDLRTIATSTGLDTLVIAADIVHTYISLVSPEDTLDVALRKIAPRDLEVIPVVADEGKNKLIGLLKKGDIYSAYNRRVIEKLSKPEQ
jgi:CIC family chloride channel protein